MVGERLCSSGTRLDVISSPAQSGAQASGGVKTSNESVPRALKSVSKQSLLGKTRKFAIANSKLTQTNK